MLCNQFPTRRNREFPSLHQGKLSRSREIIPTIADATFETAAGLEKLQHSHADAVGNGVRKLARVGTGGVTAVSYRSTPRAVTDLIPASSAPSVDGGGAASEALVCTKNLDSDVVVMQSTEESM
jgi:hypothetical protein